MKTAKSQRFVPPLLVILCLSTFLEAHDDVDVADVGFVTASFTSTGTTWSESLTYVNLKGYTDRPDPQLLTSVDVEWDSPDIDTFGNLCTVRGRLVLKHAESGAEKPVDWFQGITVSMARSPDTTPDWTSEMNPAETLSTSVVATSAGRFRARLDLRSVAFDRHLEHQFCFGIALSEHKVLSGDSQQVTSSSKTPAVAGSVKFLKVPATPPVAPELALIDAAADWPFQNPDTTNLIRAANALKRLGKARALAALEEYLDLVGRYDDRDIVFWLIHVLFEPIRLDERIPTPLIAVAVDGDESAVADQWPDDVIVIMDDVPLMLGRGIGMGGMPEHPSSHIQWARQQGVLREKPLQPATDPFAVADVVLRTRWFRNHRRDNAPNLKAQVLAMVRPRRIVQYPDELLDFTADDDWEEARNEVRRRGMHWDTREEQFVFDDQ